jgi:hypothetical protein
MSGERARTPRWRRYLRLMRANPRGDVDDELAFHLDMRTERNVALGMSPDDARREAEERFGNVAPVRDALVEHDAKQHVRTERAELLSDLVHDLRFGARSLRRAPCFALLRRIFQALAFRAILWLILVAAVFYLHSGQFIYLLLVVYFALFSILQRLAIDIIRAQTRSITAAAFFGAILLAGFTLAILPVA